MPEIHPTAVISSEAIIADTARVGPFCVIEGKVTLAEGVRLVDRVSIRGPVEIGANSTLYSNAAVGFPGQHTGIDHDAPSPGVRIGSGTTLRENVTVNAGLPTHDTPTVIGDDCYFMNGAHFGHDVVCGNEVILASNAVVGGHSQIGDRVFLSGNSCLHQHVRVGRGVMMTGCEGASRDIPPFTIMSDRNIIGGLNLVGMRRGGVPRAEITIVRKAYAAAFRNHRTREDIIAKLEPFAAESPVVGEIRQFILDAKRGICTGEGTPRAPFTTWLKRAIKPEAWADNAWAGADEDEDS